jgi:putative ABC transport system permease protein
VISWFALRALARVRMGAGFSWRYGVAAMRRRAGATVAQVVALSLGLMAMLILTVIRGDLVDTWRKTVPVDAPNRFVINIQPEQREGIAEVFRSAGVATPEIYPMVRGRVVEHNGKPVAVNDYADQRARRNVDRELNLSYMAQLPAHNKVSAGEWFDAAALKSGALSMEEGIAKTLGVKLGDTLTFEVGGQRVTAPVTSLRKLNWDSMRVNFFVIATPGLLEGMPTSFISAFNLSPAKGRFTDTLVQRFPNLSVVDVGAIVKQVQTVIEQVVRAVQFIFFFTLAAGLMVLYAALNASQDERVKEAGIMRALGAASHQLRASQLTEFALIGLLAGFFAACGAAALGAAVGQYVLQLPIGVTPMLWVYGMGGGALAALAGGWLGLSKALARPPLHTIREAAV